MRLLGFRRAGVLLGGFLLSIASVAAAPALAALPPGYQVQRVDSPIPAPNVAFGNGVAPIGDADGDGKEDFVNVASAASLNNDGIVWLFSGATGQLLRAVNAADPGGAGGRTFSNGYASRMGDIGSCADAPAPDPAQPGPTCASTTIGPPDGTGEILVGAGGMDVGGVQDTGRVYVLDGRTLAVLKRIDMPPAERALIAARKAENPSLSVTGGFGRTATTPRGLPPCEGNAGLGPCPTQTAMPRAVRIGDTDGGEVADVVIGANNFPENRATAHPESHCASIAGTSTFPDLCLGAGRAYVYRGEEIAGTDPSVILDGTGPGQTPPKIIKNIAAQADDPFSSGGKRTEILGNAQMPVGDLGRCRTGGAFAAVAPGERCTAAAVATVPDGKPDYIVTAQRADTPIFDPDPAFFEVGVAFLFDGVTGALMYTYNHPEPVANAQFGFTPSQQFALGNLGDTAAPDVVLASHNTVNGKSQAGRAYVFSGNVNANFINFAVMDDPTPNTFGRFGSPTEGVGDLVAETPGNEVLVGQFSAVQTPGKSDQLFDVSFFNPADEQALQTISDPDLQDDSGFGARVMPLGDLNDDGFLDFAVGSPRFDAPGAGGGAPVASQGRLYIFRSDPNAAVSPPPGPPAGPPGPGGPAGTGGPPGPGGGETVIALAGRTIDLASSSSRVRRGGRVRLRGVIEAFTGSSVGCERNQLVLLQRRAVRGKRFATFRRVWTDRTGAFLSSWFRVKSTRLYRARVAQTRACAGAQSPHKLVTVVKAKKKFTKKKSNSPYPVRSVQGDS